MNVYKLIQKNTKIYFIFFRKKNISKKNILKKNIFQKKIFQKKIFKKNISFGIIFPLLFSRCVSPSCPPVLGSKSSGMAFRQRARARWRKAMPEDFDPKMSLL